MIDFTAIDFETADPNHPCSLGLAVVKDSKVVQVKHWLIKPSCYPYFHYFAQKIHGIKKQDVEFEPEFDELWTEIKPFIEGQTLVAHNADFDIGILRKTLKHYKLSVPSFRYFCSYRTARIVWKEGKKASLDFLCKQENIELEHHNADSDAYACALLFLRELELLGISDLSQLQKISKQVTKDLRKEKQERETLKQLRRSEKQSLKDK